MKAGNGFSHSTKTANIILLDLVQLTSSWDERGTTKRHYKAVFRSLGTAQVIIEE